VGFLAAVGGLFMVIASLVAFDLLAIRYGVDSRPSIGDDHARSIRR
jgi:hypothetical protein